VKIIIKKYINPTLEESNKIHCFLNSGYFDCEVNQFQESQIYYVAYHQDIIVGARKVLTNFQEYVEHSKWNKRLIEYVNFNKKVYYLQALAVREEYRCKGIGTLLLRSAVEDIQRDEKRYQIFTSLCDTNTLKDQYIEKYGFIVLKKITGRLVLGIV
jgi:GNAT superfamily N-acetyltransferase